MPVQGQLVALAALAGCGAALGVGYDLYNTVLQERRGWRWFAPFADLAFWTAGLAVVFRVLLATVNGEMRLNFLVILGLGFGLYRIWFHEVVVRSTQKVVSGITYCFRFVRKLMIVLIWQPIVFVCGLLLAVLDRILRFLTIFENMILWPLTPVLAWWRRLRATKEAESSRRRPWSVHSIWTAGRNWLKRMGRRR